jgi:hypothetical protein
VSVSHAAYPHDCSGYTYQNVGLANKCPPARISIYHLLAPRRRGDAEGIHPLAHRGGELVDGILVPRNWSRPTTQAHFHQTHTPRVLETKCPTYRELAVVGDSHRREVVAALSRHTHQRTGPVASLDEHSSQVYTIMRNKSDGAGSFDRNHLLVDECPTSGVGEHHGELQTC